MMGNPKAFSSGREFAAWAGLAPKQTGSGGKVDLHGISGRGDTYLRTLLIHGARSVLTHAKEPGEWVEQMKKRDQRMSWSSRWPTKWRGRSGLCSPMTGRTNGAT
ncbi:transposase [Paraburkholderia youngii]